jgi:hypothetical protein
MKVVGDKERMKYDRISDTRKEINDALIEAANPTTTARRREDLKKRIKKLEKHIAWISKNL